MAAPSSALSCSGYALMPQMAYLHDALAGLNSRQGTLCPVGTAVSAWSAAVARLACRMI